MPEITKKTILVVEDEKPILHAIQEKLKKEGFLPIGAEDGEEGLREALEKQPDLVLLDLIMPKMTGFQMLRRLRQEGEYGKKVPVIILTNLSVTDRVSKELEGNEPSYYLVKSDWKIEDVVKKIRETLGF